ncbi:outer membrane protein [Sphingorhabdus sp. EL138]|uniref:outer membrane protein n=1 Tax=Sphingorhabdus sp. EL138 TaxID=2073156 RepID=UPI000D698C4F|nr:outer membrane beta-barrel protein [Sphingorhabdus sp. EL138]
MKIFTLAVAAAAFFVASPVIAKDTRDFSGFKGTAVVGYDNADFGVFITTERFDLKNAEGLIYGINLGYDRQSGSFLYGIELEATDSAADVDDRFLGQIEMGRELYAGGRVGFVVSGNTLIYGKAGYVDARLRTVGFQSIGLDGFRVGGGVEYKINKSIFARAEYRYSEIDRGVKRNQGVVGLGVNF